MELNIMDTIAWVENTELGNLYGRTVQLIKENFKIIMYINILYYIQDPRKWNL